MDGFDELIAGVGDILGIEGLAPDAEGVCTLESDETEIRVIHCPEADDMLLLTATVMPAPPDGGRMFLAALDANHRFKGTRGATVSLDGESDELVLSRYLPVGILSPKSLLDAVEAFSSALMSLRAVEAGVGAPPSAASDEADAGDVAAETIEVDGVVVEVSQGDDGVIVALSDLGEAPDDSVFVRELLVANHLFEGTAGATLSLEAATNRVFLQQKIYPEAEDSEDWLPRRLAVFVDKASEWKARLHGSAETEGDSSQPLQMSGFIQV